MTGQALPGNDTAINLGLGLIAAVGALAGLLRVAGSRYSPTRPGLPLRCGHRG